MFAERVLLRVFVGYGLLCVACCCAGLIDKEEERGARGTGGGGVGVIA